MSLVSNGFLEFELSPQSCARIDHTKTDMQCCQVAEVLAEQLKRGWGNKVGRKNFWPNFTKRDRRKCSKEVPYLTVQTHFQIQRKTFEFDPSCECCIGISVKFAERFWSTEWKEISGPGNTVMWFRMAGKSVCVEAALAGWGCHWVHPAPRSIRDNPW
jgi:hypothetical protein